jgi:ectoine hydroxylase-related dioxygenase (phytanoyl-CoA dioxygenase family)
MTNLLSEGQLARLSELGYLKLPAAIPVHDALAMRARMWEALGIGGADREDRSTWRTVDRKALKRAGQRDAFAAYASPTVRAVADQLLGAGRWRPPAHWGLTMVTFPEGGEWSVPHRGWHLDSSPRTGPADRLIRTFGLLDTHETGGGATMIVSGSHRLVARMEAQLTTNTRLTASAVARRALASSDAWFDDLFRPGAEPGRSRWLMTEPGVVDGVEVGVVEFTGEAGDLYLMHPWALHAASSNCRDQPRLMLMMALFRADDELTATEWPDA